MTWTTHLRKRAFTLIELLVVIAIIGILATLVFVNVQGAAAKARDSKRKNDLQAIAGALSLYYNAHTAWPTNFNPCCGVADSSTYWDQSMQMLIADKYFGAVPHSPSRNPNVPYNYYGYDPAYFPYGAILQTLLEASPPQNEPYPGSQRPWPQRDSNGNLIGDNWCSTTYNSTEYCLLIKPL